MIEWWTVTSIIVALAVGVYALGSGIRGTAPRDTTVLGTLGTALVLVIHLVVGIVQPAVGNPAHGDPLEWWMYLVTALAMTVGVTIWALIDRTRFATIGLGIVNVAVAVMIVRMSVIWTGA